MHERARLFEDLEVSNEDINASKLSEVHRTLSKVRLPERLSKVSNIFSRDQQIFSDSLQEITEPEVMMAKILRLSCIHFTLQSTSSFKFNCYQSSTKFYQITF